MTSPASDPVGAAISHMRHVKLVGAHQTHDNRRSHALAIEPLLLIVFLADLIIGLENCLFQALF